MCISVASTYLHDAILVRASRGHDTTDMTHEYKNCAHLQVEKLIEETKQVTVMVPQVVPENRTIQVTYTYVCDVTYSNDKYTNVTLPTCNMVDSLSLCITPFIYDVGCAAAADLSPE